MSRPPSFVHLLLFQCPRCGQPIPLAVTSDTRSLETVDARSAITKCECGWIRNMVGASAKRHWVEPWESIYEIRSS